MRRLIINRCGTCGIVLPSLLPSGARVVSGALCAHKNDREYVYAETGAWPVPEMTGAESSGRKREPDGA